MKNTAHNTRFAGQDEISCPFQVTSQLDVVNMATEKVHGNTVILATFDTYEAAERWVGMQYLLNA